MLPHDVSADIVKHGSRWQGRLNLLMSIWPFVQVEGFCNRIHKGIIKQFKYALVWGTSVKHRPQKVGKEHVLQDEDIVQIVKKI